MDSLEEGRLVPMESGEMAVKITCLSRRPLQRIPGVSPDPQPTIPPVFPGLPRWQISFEIARTGVRLRLDPNKPTLRSGENRTFTAKKQNSLTVLNLTNYTPPQVSCILKTPDSSEAARLVLPMATVEFYLS